MSLKLVDQLLCGDMASFEHTPVLVLRFIIIMGQEVSQVVTTLDDGAEVAGSIPAGAVRSTKPYSVEGGCKMRSGGKKLHKVKLRDALCS